MDNNFCSDCWNAQAEGGYCSRHLKMHRENEVELSRLLASLKPLLLSACCNAKLTIPERGMENYDYMRCTKCGKHQELIK